jgi:hypothetical protein
LTVDLPAQAAAQQNLSQQLEAQSTVKELATHFAGKPNKKRLTEIDRLLQSMAAMGAVRQRSGKWTSVQGCPASARPPSWPRNAPLDRPAPRPNENNFVSSSRSHKVPGPALQQRWHQEGTLYVMP